MVHFIVRLKQNTISASSKISYNWQTNPFCQIYNFFLVYNNIIASNKYLTFDSKCAYRV